MQFIQITNTIFFCTVVLAFVLQLTDIEGNRNHTLGICHKTGTT